MKIFCIQNHKRPCLPFKVCNFCPNPIVGRASNFNLICAQLNTGPTSHVIFSPNLFSYGQDTVNGGKEIENYSCADCLVINGGTI